MLLDPGGEHGPRSCSNISVLSQPGCNRRRTSSCWPTSRPGAPPSSPVHCFALAFVPRRISLPAGAIARCKSLPAVLIMPWSQTIPARTTRPKQPPPPKTRRRRCRDLLDGADTPLHFNAGCFGKEDGGCQENEAAAAAATPSVLWGREMGGERSAGAALRRLLSGGSHTTRRGLNCSVRC